ncbi:MAG: hypothetical protein ACHQHN_09960 [Sphingobacteriales bacterium]
MYKLARHIFTLLLVLGFSYTSFGQLRPVRPGFRRPPNFEQRVIRRQNKIEQVREVYIGRRLKMTSDEATRFWPVYRQYQDALTVVRQEQTRNISKNQPDGAEQVQNELRYEAEIVKIRQHYTDEFLKILPSPKVSELLKAEKEFRDELIRQLRERSQPVTTAAPATTTPAN